MPQAGIAAILEAAGATAGVAAAAAIIQSVLINLALGFLAKKLAKRPDNSVPPLNVTIRNTIEPRHLIVGTRRTGGVLVFYGGTSTGGSKRDLLWYVIVFAGHQVSAIHDIWFDTEKIAEADINSGNAAGGAVGGSSKFAGKAWVWKHLGTAGQTVDTNADGAFTDWTSDHRLQGCAYVVVELQRDDSVFTSGAPQSITGLVDGALAYDPRLDSTNGGSGSHRADDPSTWAFTRNPALLAQWYVTGGSVVNDQTSRMIRYGLREPYTRIPVAYVVAAANHCDETLSGANTTPAGDESRYRCDGEFTCGESRRDILTAILESMAGGAVMVHGQWRIFAGVYDTPIHTLTQADLYEDDFPTQDTSTHQDRYNAVSATYVDASQQYVDATTPFRTNSSYETQDNGEQIPKDPPLDLRCVTSQYQAQRIAEIDLRRSRMMRTPTLIGALNLLKVAPWETLLYSHARYGWTNRVFRCKERQFDYTKGAGRVALTCQREDSGVYTDLVTADYTTGTSATGAFQDDGPSSPTSLTPTSVPSGIKFVVGLPADFQVQSVIELYEYTSSTPFGSATRVVRFSGDTYVLSKRDTTTRYYWALIRDRKGIASGTYPASTGQAGVADVAIGSQTAAINTTLTQVQHIPDGFSFNDTLASISFTPTVNCDIIVTANFSIDYTTDAGGSGEAQVQMSIQDGTYDGFKKKFWYQTLGAGNTARSPATIVQRFAATAGASVTYTACAAKFASGDTVTCSNGQLILQALQN